MFHLYFYLFFFFFPDRLTRVRWLCCELSWFLHRNFECPYVKFTVVCYNVVNVSLLCRECACNVVRLNIYHSFGFVDRKIDHRPNELEEFSCSLRKVVQWSCDGLFFFFVHLRVYWTFHSLWNDVQRRSTFESSDEEKWWNNKIMILSRRKIRIAFAKRNYSEKFHDLEFHSKQ